MISKSCSVLVVLGLLICGFISIAFLSQSVTPAHVSADSDNNISDSIANECIPLTGVNVTGPGKGIVDVQYTFPVTITPANATAPFTYVVSIETTAVVITPPMESLLTIVTPQASTAFSTIYPIRSTWHHSGSFKVGIERAYNACGGPVSDYHTINITTTRFTLNIIPTQQFISPGGVAVYDIQTQAFDNFTHTVVLTATSPDSSLSLELDSTGIIPGQSALLTITDHHTGTILLPGLWHTMPITAVGGDIIWIEQVKLLVGGANTYLPLILRNF